MRALEDIAGQLNITMDDLLNFDQTLSDIPEVATALQHGDWTTIREHQIDDDDAAFIVSTWHECTNEESSR